MKTYTVTGMSCAACSTRVEKAVSRVEGVSSCSVSLLTNTMGVEGEASPETVIAAVEAAGYGAKLNEVKSIDGSAAVKTARTGGTDPREDALKDRESPGLIRRLIASAAVLLILMYCSMGHAMWNWPLPKAFDDPVVSGIFQMFLAAVVMVINQKFFVNGFKALFHGGPNMDTLVALGAGTAFLYSFVQLMIMASERGNAATEGQSMSMHGDLYFESAAMILTLITIGKLLEARSKGKTTDALKGLFKLTPKTASVEENGTEREIPVENVRIGDIFIVRPGENFPVDGVVVEGNAAVDESAITGESVPVDKQPGDNVYTASVNRTGFLKCRATRVGEDTTLNQIIKMVSDAANTKAPLARIADKVSGVFVPVVTLIALLTLACWLIAGRTFSFAIARAITVLVISCPCALGLATPVAIMVGSGVGARNGILYKTATSLESLGRTKIFALDKTGTITSGEPSVTAVFPVNGMSETQLLTLAASLEAGSEHPLGRAIIRHAESLGIESLEITGFEALPGNGLKASLKDGRLLTGGSVAYIDATIGAGDELKALSNEQAGMGKTPLVFAVDGTVIGMICTEDTIRDDSAEAVASLKKAGCSVVMLTGDNERTASAVGSRAGVDEVIAGVRPDGKAEAVESLKKRGKTAMVGDGINDAPALVTADVGLAIGAGADVAIDAADIVIVKNRLTDVFAAFNLSRAVVRNIYENLFWAFIYNIICIPLAIGVFGLTMKPVYGALAMSLSSFCVCMNALRLNFVKLYGKKNDNKNVKTSGKKEDLKMVKTFKVEGMMCAHCEARVKKALEAIDGVETAAPDHNKNECVVVLSRDVADEVLKKAVEDQGYTAG